MYPSIFYSLVLKVQCFSFHEFLKQLLNFRTYIERNSSFFFKTHEKNEMENLENEIPFLSPDKIP